MRQPLDALHDEIVRPSLERFDQARIERPTAILEQGAKGHVECQRVLERALEIGKRLVSKRNSAS